MDDVNEVTFFEIDPAHVARANPFGEAECAVIQISRAVNVSQLADEIQEKTGEAVQISLTNPHPGVPIGPENKGVLYVTPSMPEETLVLAINGHVADDLYGMPAGQRERIRLVEKLESGEELTASEMNRALRLILAQ